MKTEMEHEPINKKRVSEIFFKLFNNAEYLDRLVSEPLLLAVLIECARRARRRKDISPDGLEQGEFFLSRTEYKKFGLKATQQGKIERRLHVLAKWNLIKKTDKRISNETGKDKSIVWGFLANKIIMPLFQIDIAVDNEIDKEQAIDRQTSVSKEDKRRTDEISEIPSAAGGGENNIKKVGSYKSDPIIEYCREVQGIEQQFLNYGKQLFHLKRIREQYPDDEDTKWVIEQMAAETYWQENPFDMSNVANNMYKYLNRVIRFDK